MRSFGRFMLAMLMVACFITPAMAILPSTRNASASSGIEVALEHPEFAGINATVPCVMTITGGPAESGGNYSYGATIIGTNTTGASIDPPNGPSQTSGVFKFNVTMPVAAHQTIKIRINATSQSHTNTESDTLQKDFEIAVVVPVVIEATAMNSGPVPVTNVTAKFFADGTLLHTATYNISANGTQKLSYNWTFLKIKSGKHIVTVTVDDPNNIVEFSDGNNIVSREIWVGKQSNVVGALLSGGVVVLAVLVFLMWLQKPQRKGKK